MTSAAHIPISTLRENGWVFDMGGSSEPWYKFYSFFSEIFVWYAAFASADDYQPPGIQNTSFSALWATMPTQLAL